MQELLIHNAFVFDENRMLVYADNLYTQLPKVLQTGTFTIVSEHVATYFKIQLIGHYAKKDMLENWKIATISDGVLTIIEDAEYKRRYSYHGQTPK